MIRNKKRRPFQPVNRSRQYRFLAVILIYNVIIVGFLAIVLFVPDIIRMQDQALSIGIRAMAADRILTLHSRVWPIVIVIICFIGVHSFRGFSRFVGPLYRFAITFKEIHDGNLDCRLKLRKKDHLHPEAEMINEMLHILNKRLGHIQATGLDALNVLDRLESNAKEKNGRIELDRENLTGLRQHLDELVASANYFRTEQT